MGFLLESAACRSLAHLPSHPSLSTSAANPLLGAAAAAAAQHALLCSVEERGKSDSGRKRACDEWLVCGWLTEIWTGLIPFEAVFTVVI